MRTFIVLLIGLFSFVSLFAQENVDKWRREAQGHLQQRNYLAAIQPLFLGEAELEGKKQLDTSLAWFYVHTALCYEYFESQQNAIKYLHEAIAIYKRYGHKNGEAYAQVYLGDILEDDGLRAEARKRIYEGLSYFETAKDSFGLCLAWENVGSLLEGEGKLDSALWAYSKALQLAEHQAAPLRRATILNNIGDTYYLANRFPDALKAYTNSLALADSIGDEEEKRGNYKDLSKVYASIGRFDQAYLFSERYIDINKKLKVDHKIDGLLDQQALFLQEKQAGVLQSIEQEQALARLRFYLVISILALALALASLLYFGLRYRWRKDQKLAALNQRLLEIEIQSETQRRDSLEKELAARQKEIKEYINTVVDKNKQIEELKGGVASSALLETEEVIAPSSLLTETDWLNFKRKFTKAFPAYFDRLKAKCPELSAGDMRLVSLMRIGLGREEMAGVLGISPDSVKKAQGRFKKKLLQSDAAFKPELDLADWISKI